MNSVEARAAYVRMLMDRVREARHPSVTHMALIEEALPPQWIPDYVEILLQKVADDPNPSIPMLRRIRQLIDAAP